MKPKFEVLHDDETGRFRWQVLDEKGVPVRFTPGSVVGVRPDKRAKADVQAMLAMHSNARKSSAA